VYGTPLLVPPAVVTVAKTVPVPTGVIAVIPVSETTVKDVAGAAPKLTAVASVNPVPVMVTVLPPVSGPELGTMEIPVGAGI
jgi:hypothetical protein